ncbi:Shedu anti-phage system protein SduA domain-containing protein [Actinoplanes sp. NPDC051861]|uniref:Shedu anti-phage system protein SduA domain-containing protein n=1 Tax=Actinoplanes sp. NPDC051861 TaxID=3155170 RepID=UPI00342BE463
MPTRFRLSGPNLLAHDPEEREVQQFLELHPAMVPGGSGDVGPGGHHGPELRALFRLPKLLGSGPTFEPDFMWVTRSSSLITPILVEIEKPSKRWFRQDGRPTAEFREAHDQLNDWRAWFARDDNVALFRKRFLFFDSYNDRPIEPQYLLVFGRQSEFETGGGHVNPDTLRFKRDQQRATNESFMTFDSLHPRFDHSRTLTVSLTANGPRPYAFSPVFGTTTSSGPACLLLGDPSEALTRSVMMSDERKAYLAQRWAYWQNDALSASGQRVTHARATGIE